MTIKEKEDQLRLNLTIYIVVTVVLWVGLVTYIVFGLVSLREIPTLPLTVTTINVPGLKESNLGILRGSFKTEPSGSTTLPIIRVEPFD